MELHHFGIAVKSIEKTRQEYLLMGFKDETDVVIDSSRNIKILFMVNSGIRIELIEKSDVNIPSPIDSYLSRGINAHIYHSCYVTEDMSMDIENLREEGYLPITESEPAPAIQNRKVCFLYKKAVGIIELVEK